MEVRILTDFGERPNKTGKILVWIVNVNRKNLSPKFQSVLDGKIEKGYEVPPAEVTIVSQDELGEKIVDYGEEKLGLPKSSGRFSMDIPNTKSLPVLTTIDFSTIDTLNTSQPVYQTSGKISGEKDVLFHLKTLMVDMDVANEMSTVKSDDKLAIIFV